MPYISVPRSWPLVPGLGLSAWSRSLLKQALATAQPKVVDADALNLLAKQSYVAPRNDWILTPHPGEAARLLNTQVAVVQANRQQAACDLQQKFGGIIILKGAATIVVHHALIPFVCQAGNPGMASGGMGDVLTGIIAGLLSQGRPMMLLLAVFIFMPALVIWRLKRESVDY